MIYNVLPLGNIAGQEKFLPTLFLQIGGAGGFDPTFFIMMGGMFIIVYFFMIRPQQKKAKDQKAFLTELKKGDKVVTIGGIHGKIFKADEETLVIEVDTTTKLKIERSAVSLDNTRRINAEAGKPEAVKKDAVSEIKE
jgi:preprotein translocase subunit YajC